MAMTEAEVDQINYDRILQMYADRFADASDFTFLFVGNINEDTIRTLSEQYLATLPVVKRDDKPVDVNMPIAAGDILNHYRRDMQTPQAFIVSVWAGPAEVSVRNSALVSILGQCLSETYLKKIREELGAAYTTSANGRITRNSDDEPVYVLQAAFPLKPEMTDTCLTIVQDVLNDIAANGPAEESVGKAKEYMLKTYTQNQRENGFWQGRITTQLQRGYDPYENYENIVTAITPADIRDLASYILAMGNRVRILLEPEHDGDGNNEIDGDSVDAQ